MSRVRSADSAKRRSGIPSRLGEADATLGVFSRTADKNEPSKEHQTARLALSSADLDWRTKRQHWSAMETLVQCAVAAACSASTT